MVIVIRRQISVALNNQPGSLSRICDTLSGFGINIDALTLIDNVEQGMVRLLLTDSAKALRVLEQEKFFTIEAEVLDIQLERRMGILGQVSRFLAENQINIDYAYGTEGPDEGPVRIVMKVSDATRAAEILHDFTPAPY